MAGLVPAIHDVLLPREAKAMDGRNRSGHDDLRLMPGGEAEFRVSTPASFRRRHPPVDGNRAR
jgi:hypothetical protein